MKKILVGFLVFALLCTTSLVVFAKSFNDVGAHWASSSISRLSDEKVIEGYPDGSYNPEGNITRAEFATIIARLFETTKSVNLSSYKDINPSAWYYNDVAKAVALGVLDGSTSAIRPNDYVTREEAMNGLNVLYNLVAKSNDSALAKFSDSNRISSWAKSSVAALTDFGYIHGYPDGTVKPNAFITRAEFAKLLDDAVALIITESGDYDMSAYTTSVIVKAKNVNLTGTENLDRIFVLDDDMNDTLTVDGKKASNAIVITHIEKVDEKKGSAGGGGGVSKLTISLAEYDDDVISKYTITKTGGSIAEGKYLTVEVVDATPVKNWKIGEKEYDSQMKKLIAELDVERTINTIEADYSDIDVEAFAGAWARAALSSDDISDEAYAAALAAYHTADSSSILSEVYEALVGAGATDEAIKDSMAETFGTYITYDAALTQLKVIHNS